VPKKVVIARFLSTEAKPGAAVVPLRFVTSEIHTTGGVQQFVLRYADLARRRGHDAVIIAGVPHGVEPSPIDNFLPVPGMGKAFSVLAFVRLLRVFLQQPKDAVFILGSLNAALSGALAGTILGRPTVFVVHGLTSRCRTGLSAIAARAAELVAASLSSRMVYLNEADRQVLSWVKSGPIVPNGVALVAPWEPRHPDRNRIRLLCVARHEYPKNLRALLTMFGGLPVGRFSLTLIGEGAEYEENASFAATLPNASDIILVKSVPAGEVPYNEHDVFVLSSRSEGMPLSILEAWAAGLPVICTKVPGLDGLVEAGVTGEFLADLTSKSLEDALVAVLDEYQSYAVAARRTVAERFSIEARSNELFEVAAALNGVR
jgi:glycosyltransferase involved in cell wall biosynthesis